MGVSVSAQQSANPSWIARLIISRREPSVRKGLLPACGIPVSVARMASALRCRDDGVKPVGAEVEAVRFTQESPIRNFIDSSHVLNFSFTERS
jgi:hypothetical protein